MDWKIKYLILFFNPFYFTKSGNNFLLKKKQTLKNVKEKHTFLKLGI